MPSCTCDCRLGIVINPAELSIAVTRFANTEFACDQVRCACVCACVCCCVVCSVSDHVRRVKTDRQTDRQTDSE